MRDTVLETWADSIDEFPLAGTPAEKLDALVRVAMMAPSVCATQPWLTRVVGEALELRLNPGLRLAEADPADREPTISCGAALGFIEAALHRFGYQGRLTLLPFDDDPDLLARIELGESRVATDADRALFAAIGTRHITRLPFLHRAPDTGLLAALEAYGNHHGVWCELVQFENRQRTICTLVEQADGRRASRERRLAKEAPVLLVLGTVTDTRLDWLQTGRVLSLLVLRAAGDGLAASFLNQPLECPDTRRQVAFMLGTSGNPQLILRMGYPRRSFLHPS